MRVLARAFMLALFALLASCGGDDVPAAAPAPAESPEAIARRDHAVRHAGALACAALEAAVDDPVLGLLLAREAYRVAPTPEAIEALHRTRAAADDTTPFEQHAGSTLFATWSPDGSKVLTTSLDMTVRLWNRDGSAIAVFEGHVGTVHEAAFSPDGTHIVTASIDHTARVWDLEGNQRAKLEGHTAEVLTAAFSPDGARVLTVSLDGTARVFTAQGAPVAVLQREGQVVQRAAFTLEEQSVLAVTEQGEVWVWRDGTLDVLDASTEPFERIALSDVTDRGLAITDGSSAVVLNGLGGVLGTLEGHTAPLLDAAFAPNGRMVATASLDQTARVWHLADGATQHEATAVCTGHASPVFEVDVTPDGERLLTVSSDRTARLWTLEGRELVRWGTKEAPVVGASFSPAGDRVLTTPYRRGVVRLYDLDGDLQQTLPDDTGRTLSAAWSPEGTRVLTVDRNLTPHVFLAHELALLEDVTARIDRDFTDRERRVYVALLDPEPGVRFEDTAFDSCRPLPEGDSVPLRGDFAGTVVCAFCHREDHAKWFASSHARTSYFANEADLPQAVLDGATVEHPPWTTTYRKEGDRWIARTIGEDGELQDFELSMISGHLRVRFFMSRMPDGRLQVLPAMYELPKDTWFDYSHLIFGAKDTDFDTPPTIEPGAATFWTGPVRSWDARCSHCHMSGKTAVERDLGEVGPRIVARAFAVDCEACHGPGRLHAEAWARMEMDEPMVRLETLPRETRVALCTQCHQEGEVLETPYVLGQDLYDYIDPTLLIDPERADPAGRPLELIYDGLPFATSTCANAGGLTCSTCHAPHGGEVRSLLRQPPEDGWFCIECHEDLVKNSTAHSHHAEGGSGNNCALCHLPFLTIERGHGAVADHTIGIPRLGLVADRVQPDACTWCHSGGLGAPTDAPGLTEEELWRAYEDWWPGSDGWPQPWMAALANARLGDADAGPGLVAVIADEALPREVRGSAALLLGRYAETMADALYEATNDTDSVVRRSAIKALEEIEGTRADARLLEALEDPSWAVRVAAARAALAGYQRVQSNKALLDGVIPVLEQDAQNVPDDDLRWFRLGAAYDLAGNKPKALEAYRRKAALDPLAKSVHRHVKNLEALLGLDTSD